MNEKHYITVKIKMNHGLTEEFYSFDDQKEKEKKLAKMLKEQTLKFLIDMSDEDFLKHKVKISRYLEREVKGSIISERVYY